MKHTEKTMMYVVDYESGSSDIHEFMNGDDLNRLRSEERRGSIRIVNLIALNSSDRK